MNPKGLKNFMSSRGLVAAIEDSSVRALTPAHIEQLATDVAGLMVNPCGRTYWEFGSRTLAEFAKALFEAAGPVVAPVRACNQNCNQGRDCDCGPGVGPKVDPAAWLSATQAVMPDGSVRALPLSIDAMMAEQAAEIERLMAVPAPAKPCNIDIPPTPFC